MSFYEHFMNHASHLCILLDFSASICLGYMALCSKAFSLRLIFISV